MATTGTVLTMECSVCRQRLVMNVDSGNAPLLCGLVSTDGTRCQGALYLHIPIVPVVVLKTGQLDLFDVA